MLPTAGCGGCGSPTRKGHATRPQAAFPAYRSALPSPCLGTVWAATPVPIPRIVGDLFASPSNPRRHSHVPRCSHTLPHAILAGRYSAELLRAGIIHAVLTIAIAHLVDALLAAWHSNQPRLVNSPAQQLRAFHFILVAQGLEAPAQLAPGTLLGTSSCNISARRVREMSEPARVRSRTTVHLPSFLQRHRVPWFCVVAQVPDGPLFPSSGSLLGTSGSAIVGRGLAEPSQVRPRTASDSPPFSSPPTSPPPLPCYAAAGSSTTSAWITAGNSGIAAGNCCFGERWPRNARAQPGALSNRS